MNKEMVKEKLHNNLGVIGLIIVIAFFEIVNGGQLITTRSINSLINELFAMALATSGLVFLLAQNCLDFSASGLIVLSAAVAARAGAISPYLVLPVAILTGLLLGLCNGFLHAVCKIGSFIATLSVSFICSGVAILVLERGSLTIPMEMLSWDSRTLRIIVMLIFMIGGYILFEKTKIGKHAKIVGANPEFARQSGISVVKVKIRSFMMMGAICGLIAFFALIRSATASTSTGASVTVNAVNAILIGGMPIIGGMSSKFKSAILGSCIMAVLNIGMSVWGLSAVTQQCVKGVVFLFAIYMTFDRKGSMVVK